MIRAEDLIEEDAISPNILKEFRDEARGLSRVIRSSYADIGSERTAQGYRSAYWNFITVAKHGGDFQTITEALIAIEDNSAIMRYVIFVYPGIYDEEVVMEEYVALVGLDRDVCIIQSLDYDDLITMANHSSLNELQVINEHEPDGIGNIQRAVWGTGKTDILIDSCILRSIANSLGYARGISLASCANIEVLGSDIYATNPAMVAYAGLFDGNIGRIEIRNTQFEIEDAHYYAPTADYSCAAAVNAASGSPVKFLASRFLVHGSLGHLNNSGLMSINAPSVAHCIACDFVHEDEAYTDLWARDGEIHVRGCRYETWQATGTGIIIPLAGDRPRTAQVMTDVAFTITAGAAVWENVPNMSVNIDLPCESDLYVDWGGSWYSNTVRNTAFSSRVLVDGAVGGWDCGTLGCLVATRRHQHAGRYVFLNLATGVHTLQMQVRRVNAADTVVAEQSRMSASSVPWP